MAYLSLSSVFCYSMSCLAILRVFLVHPFVSQVKKTGQIHVSVSLAPRALYFLRVWCDLCPGVRAASDDSLRASLDSFSAISHIQVPVKHQTL